MTNETFDAFEPLDVPILSLAEALELEELLGQNPRAQRILDELMSEPDRRRFDPAVLRLRHPLGLWRPNPST